MQDPDLEWEFIDGSIVRAHQHSTGAAGKENQAIGKSVGGHTTKIHIAVDACGLPIEFDLTGGEIHDSKAAPALIEKLPVSEYMIADKDYDSKDIREQFVKNHLSLSYRERKTPKRETMT